MIVYTATDEINRTVYVGSAREDLEEHWISLVNQAEGGAEGEFFEAIRKQGANKFEIEEFGFAEDSSEMRELMREAQKDLGAIPIKAGRSSVIASRAKAITAKSELEELMSIDTSSDEWSAEDDSWLEEATGRTKKTADTEKAAEPSQKPVSNEAIGSKTDTDDSGMSSMDLIKQALAEAALETGPVKKPRAAVAKKPAAKKVVAPSPDKIASGRTGSAAKEKRIKAAIESAREEREQFRQTGSTAEAAEMKNLMMGIEARRLAARQSSKTARLAEAKKKAAADRKAAAAEKKSEAKRIKALKDAIGSRKSGAVSGRAAVESSAGADEVKAAPSKKDSRAEAKLLAAKVLSARKAPVAAAPAPELVDNAKVDALAVSKPAVTVKPSAASKERRIREAIAAEKERIDAEKRARISAESPEMNALLAGLDERAKAAQSYKRKL